MNLGKGKQLPIIYCGNTEKRTERRLCPFYCASCYL